MKIKFFVIVLILLLSCCSIKAGVRPPLGRIDKPTCIITFDDGYLSVWNLAKPLMDSLGFKGNCFITCDKVNTSDTPQPFVGDSSHPPDDLSNNMSFRQLAELDADGWCIYNHTKTHQILPDSFEINSCYECLKSKGFDANVFAYPCGMYNDSIITLVRQNHIAARTTDIGLENHFYIFSENRYKLKGIYSYSDTSPEEIKSWIDFTIASNMVIILIYHGFCDSLGCGGIHGNNIYIQNFAEVLNYLYEKKENIDVITFKDYLNRK